jgi:hypothetical protein
MVISEHNITLLIFPPALSALTAFESTIESCLLVMSGVEHSRK